MAKRKPSKNQKIGYALLVPDKEGKFIRVGYTFMARYEAEQFLKRTLPHVSKFRVVGLRVNTIPLKAPSHGDAAQERA